MQIRIVIQSEWGELVGGIGCVASPRGVGGVHLVLERCQ